MLSRATLGLGFSFTASLHHFANVYRPLIERLGRAVRCLRDRLLNIRSAWLGLLRGRCVRSRLADEEPVQQIKKHRLTKDAFKEVKVIGRGGFGVVQLVKEKSSGQLLALKCMSKSTLITKYADLYISRALRLPCHQACSAALSRTTSWHPHCWGSLLSFPAGMTCLIGLSVTSW